MKPYLRSARDTKPPVWKAQSGFAVMLGCLGYLMTRKAVVACVLGLIVLGGALLSSSRLLHHAPPPVLAKPTVDESVPADPPDPSPLPPQTPFPQIPWILQTPSRSLPQTLSPLRPKTPSPLVPNQRLWPPLRRKPTSQWPPLRCKPINQPPPGRGALEAPEGAEAAINPAEPAIHAAEAATKPARVAGGLEEDSRHKPRRAQTTRRRRHPSERTMNASANVTFADGGAGGEMAVWKQHHQLAAKFMKC